MSVYSSEIMVHCAWCGGRGVNRDGTFPCGACGGTGSVSVHVGDDGKPKKCAWCEGRGIDRGGTFRCKVCGGIGYDR